MKIHASGILIALALILLVSAVAWANRDEPRRYFGPGVGYPDLGSKYFYRYYPPDQWGKYGYGTGHMGLGYGPYIYGGKRVPPAVRDRAEFGFRSVTASFKRVGANQVRVSAPNAGYVTGLTVNVLSYSGDVLETGRVTVPPFDIIAHLPDGANSVQVRIDLVNGYSAAGYSLVPDY